MKRLSQILEDHEGRLSSKRVAAFILLLMVCLQVVGDLFHWHSVQPDILDSLLMAVAAFLGISTIDRFSQKQP